MYGVQLDHRPSLVSGASCSMPRGISWTTPDESERRFPRLAPGASLGDAQGYRIPWRMPSCSRSTSRREEPNPGSRPHQPGLPLKRGRTGTMTYFPMRL